MSELTSPPVPLLQAIDMTTNWRNYYAQITGTQADDALRAFKIPLEDLQAMVDMAKADSNITAVRAYLALGEGVTSGPVNADKVHILLVPVSDTTTVGAGTDILEVEIAGKAYSTIRDFTTPCPALCDFSSPLYAVPVV